ncbi:MAG: hypothetical protein AABY16_04855 [Nanoarchaeota archaeon]
MKQDYELDYQERIGFIKGLAIPDGVNVLDSSAVINLGFSNHLSERDSCKYSKETIEAERKLLQGLAQLFASDRRYVCPLEAREEFDCFTPNYEVVGRMNPALRQMLAGLMKDRRVLFARIGKVSERLSLEASSYLDDLKRIVLKDSLEFYGAHEKLRKERLAKGSNVNHNGDDEAIFAKCVALSYSERVRLVTHDGDFRHIHRAFYDGIEDLTANGLPLPTNPVELAFVHGRAVEFIPPRRRARRLARMQA